MRGFDLDRGGRPQSAEEVGGPAPSAGGEETGKGDPDAIGETVGEGAAEKYASDVEEEKYPSVVGAGVLAGRVKDVAPPGDYGSASAGRSVTITASKVRAQGLFDLWDAIRHPGGENGDTPWVDWAHASQDPVPLP